MTMIKKLSIAAVVVGSILCAIVALSSIYRLQEDQQCVITQFGEPIKSITDAGLHFKKPFIQKIHFMDKRFLEWDGYPSQVTTGDKKFIYIDTFARWKIVDPLLYMKRIGNETNAQGRLDDAFILHVLLRNSRLIRSFGCNGYNSKNYLNYHWKFKYKDLYLNNGINWFLKYFCC